MIKREISLAVVLRSLRHGGGDRPLRTKVKWKGEGAGGMDFLLGGEEEGGKKGENGVTNTILSHNRNAPEEGPSVPFTL